MPASHLVVATAGHIDHGKSSLVRALTGIDTDRLVEEKSRGISIDLGFANLRLPSGTNISFVDVPGHEGFVKNMLAGVSGVKAALLIVAANEGVKPQTREHLEICRLLRIPDGALVLTKSDLASPDQLLEVEEEVTALCRGTVFESRRPVVVSAITGEGVQQLKAVLQQLADDNSSADGTPSLPKLYVDRSFTVKGFGTVVTGTVLAGTLETGGSMLLQPSGLPVRIRGIQTHGLTVTSARAGQRAAVNITGVEHSDVSRGDMLTTAGPYTPITFFDAELQWLSGELIPDKRQHFLLHIGTAEQLVSLKLLDRSGQWARIWLTVPYLVLPGDRFVLRRPSPAATVGGGVALDPFPPRRLQRQRLVNRLQQLSRPSWSPRLQLWVEESNNGRRVPELMRRSGLVEDELQNQLRATPELVQIPETGRIYTKQWLHATGANLRDRLLSFHREHPESAGSPLAQLGEGLDLTLVRALLNSDPQIRLQGDTVALKSHRPALQPEQAEALNRIEHAFRTAGYQPPPPAEILRPFGDLVRQRTMLETLIKTNRLVRLSPDVVLHTEVLDHIRRSLAAHKGRRFTVPEFKDWTQISRKYAIPILEYLDRQHVTKRDGDSRIVL